MHKKMILERQVKEKNPTTWGKSIYIQRREKRHKENTPTKKGKYHITEGGGKNVSHPPLSSSILGRGKD